MPNNTNGKTVNYEPTPALQWNMPYDVGVVIELPSGHRARIRPVNMSTFLTIGHIPNELLPVVEDMFINNKSDPDKITVEYYLKTQQPILDAFCKTCFVEPKVVDKVKNTQKEVAVDHIADADKLLSVKRQHPKHHNSPDCT